MKKGARTKAAILADALELAGSIGVSGLSIGSLAEHCGLSKSGLFAHFGSKEALQADVLDFAREHFTEQVVRPAWRQQSARARLASAFDGWLRWTRDAKHARSCVFFAAAPEWDDRGGEVRDKLVDIQKSWRDALARVVARGIERGEFRAELEPEQVVYDMFGIMLSYHHSAGLMRDPRAAARARRSFDRLLAGLLKPS
ncbi:MAG: TetR/AcrR family transcriptional regulator [Alphaproteobacteria bacterium]